MSGFPAVPVRAELFLQLSEFPLSPSVVERALTVPGIKPAVMGGSHLSGIFLLDFWRLGSHFYAMARKMNITPDIIIDSGLQKKIHQNICFG